jgi:alanyl-tRNA synthetase
LEDIIKYGIMTSNEIRQQFLDFFEKKGHKIVPSAPVVPLEDPTLLFTNAGMNQFKDVFLNTGTREYKRAVNTQKCIRVSGKHNDLEEVGNDTYHHTFFEMLGNWSFGNYYKKEAIGWAWELLTEVWRLPKERLWATVYRTDDEAYELWKSETDIMHDHILRFDEKDNFWEMGETGPCGPCSEIHVNLSDDYNNPIFVNAGVPECIEIWNLVFIQYNRDKNGNLHELPAKHVDTGMGFERLCAVLQKKDSNYDTDIFSPVIDEIAKLSDMDYNDETLKPSFRVIADHIRTLSFAIADGAVPSNDGRGYVLRRILRRALRYGRKLNFTKPFMYQLVDVLARTMGAVFPELKEKKNYIKKIIKAEEEGFNKTLDRGIELFDTEASLLEKEGKTMIPGDIVFRLYDTFGFPVDLTNVMAQERGLSVDEIGFNVLMEKQKDKGRVSTKEKISSVDIPQDIFKNFRLPEGQRTEFTGYKELESDAEIIGLGSKGDLDLVILDKSPFYVEAGGQISDTGSIKVEDSELEIVDVKKIDNKVIHIVKNNHKVNLSPGLRVTVAVDFDYRWNVMRNHSATHFLHKAMREILGTHVQQSGSYVGPDRLRFDFTHFQKLSETEINDIEKRVNEQLRRNLPLIHHRDIPFEEAKKMGALMFFGDKYGDKVNVVQFGDYTIEFCGGTHIQNSSQIGLFKITSESSIASGVRRIEAVTGAGVENYIRQLVMNLKKSDERIHELTESKKHLEKEFAELKLQSKLGQIDKIIQSPSTAGEIYIYKGIVDAESMDELKIFGDELRMKIKNGVGVLFSAIEDKAGIVAVVSDDLLKEKKMNAGKIVGDIARLLGGGGGGRPHLATAGAKEIDKINNALEKVEEIIKNYI